jgi:predicted MFS family arabinose efflux permease
VTDPVPRDRTVGLSTLFLARTVYAFNWYDIGGVLSLVRASFGVGPVQLGIVLGSFLVGAGLFQVPAGLAAMRWGNRTVSLIALVTMGAFSLAAAAAPSWPILAALRFGAGAGAAFFFAPALGLVASYYPSGQRGPAIGLFNSGFSVGSGIGLFTGAIVGAAFGWHVALAVGGIALLATAAVAPRLLPRLGGATVPRPAGAGLLRAARPVLRSRSIWALAIGTTGLWGAFYIAAQYFVEYASAVHPVWTLAVAAAIPTAMIAAEVPGGPIGGWLGERGRDLRGVLAAWGACAALVIALVPFLSLDLSWPAFVFLGFADGVVFAVLYLVPTYLPGLTGGELSLGLSLLNSIQIFAGSGFAIAFGAIAATWGYAPAWWFAGIGGAAFLPALLFVRVPRAGDPAPLRAGASARRPV